MVFRLRPWREPFTLQDGFRGTPIPPDSPDERANFVRRDAVTPHDELNDRIFQHLFEAELVLIATHAAPTSVRAWRAGAGPRALKKEYEPESDQERDAHREETVAEGHDEALSPRNTVDRSEGAQLGQL
jgi:hypothetical protein